jgi:hypothetical protein
MIIVPPYVQLKELKCSNLSATHLSVAELRPDATGANFVCVLTNIVPNGPLLFIAQMPPYPEEIESLPSETRSKLRSTQILTSIPQIISELVQNSLDANAKHVDIGINREEWTFYVKDDGHGMSKEDMRILSKGGEEGRYGDHSPQNNSGLS